MSSTSRGLAPREGLECLLVKMGRTGPLAEPRCRPQTGRSGDPHSENTDSSPRAQGALGLGLAAKPKGKCGAPQAPTACGLGRCMATDWTWASPLPHPAPISAWLGGHGALHSYFLLAGSVLPIPPSSSSLCSRFQSDLSSAPSIAMAPTSTKKGKKPLLTANPPLTIEPAIGRSRVLNL